MSAVWFTSDQHFGHKRILGLGRGRPFVSVEEMDHELIRRWNDSVEPGDRVYTLGDFSWYNRERTEQIISHLNGEIHGIRGNHDGGNESVYKRMFASYRSMHPLRVGDDLFVLCHYPLLTWQACHHGAYMLHGHCHGNLTEDPALRRMDVGVDCHAFAPISLDEVTARLGNRNGLPRDYEGN